MKFFLQLLIVLVPTLKKYLSDPDPAPAKWFGSFGSGSATLIFSQLIFRFLEQKGSISFLIDFEKVFCQPKRSLVEGTGTLFSSLRFSNCFTLISPLPRLFLPPRSRRRLFLFTVPSFRSTLLRVLVRVRDADLRRRFRLPPLRLRLRLRLKKINVLST